jgi:enamine deaminase RidA (YjgF/YER057c/UK114 family)
MTQIRRFQTTPRFSRSVVHNGVVYLAGQTASDCSLGVADQTRQVLDKIDALLVQAGSDKSRILRADVWLSEVERDFAAMTAVWEAWSPPGCAPARSVMQAQLLSPGALVEIVVTAAL